MKKNIKENRKSTKKTEKTEEGEVVSKAEMVEVEEKGDAFEGLSDQEYSAYLLYEK